jgi:hypothetical protein
MKEIGACTLSMENENEFLISNYSGISGVDEVGEAHEEIQVRELDLLVELVTQNISSMRCEICSEY